MPKGLYFSWKSDEFALCCPDNTVLDTSKKYFIAYAQRDSFEMPITHAKFVIVSGSCTNCTSCTIGIYLDGTYCDTECVLNTWWYK